MDGLGVTYTFRIRMKILDFLCATANCITTSSPNLDGLHQKHWETNSPALHFRGEKNQH